MSQAQLNQPPKSTNNLKPIHIILTVVCGLPMSCCFCSGVLSLVLGPAEKLEVSAESDQNATKNTTPQQQSKAPPAIEATGTTPQEETLALRQLFAKNVRATNLSLVVNDYAYDSKKKIILVRFDIDDQLTEHLIRFGCMTKIESILKAVVGSKIPCHEVTVFGSIPLSDKFGNIKKGVVAKATYSGQTIARINWDNFLTDNIFEIADDKSLHPTFSK